LEKACHKLRSISEVLLQRITVTELDNATRQLHQLSCILDSCTIYEVSEALALWKFVALWGATWHWCDLTLIEPSVVKLDYGKVYTTGFSSFGIPLRYTELQEMI